jgi:hypothetical protein
MPRADSVFVKLAGLALLVAVAAALTPQSSFGQKPPILETPLDVNVVNTPLAVTGDIGVSGAISATQSGVWNVGLSGTPSVKSGDATVLLGSFSGEVPGGSVFTEAVSFADASGAKTVRVLTNCFVGGDCANILVRVYTVVGGRSYLVEQFPMQNFVVAGGVYDVIGTNVTVQLLNNNPGATSNIGVAVFGRAN